MYKTVTIFGNIFNTEPSETAAF